MAKIIRPSYPKEISIGLILLVFALSFFLSGQLFEKYQPNGDEGLHVYAGMFLASVAVLIMVLILWEELLFPVHAKPADSGLIFRNHRTKLKIQGLIYISIPILIIFIYMNWNVNLFRFIGFSFVCLVAPVAGKLISGIKNYNDFLKLTDEFIEYKNNELEGKYKVSDIQKITLIKDNSKVLHKFQVTINNTDTVIDIDEMELEAFYETIDSYLTTHYSNLIK